ncbi:hypothetical protein V8G56_01320 [Gaetbulibacter aquiaggeris]|uniref:Lipoprotein n=1 Tax=Gaetbulibacter aquiaggeris TaxID=1735373 RepID=A0ABW7MKW1_9FLAO
MKAIILILSVLILTNCKNEKPIDSLELVTLKPVESNVKVVLEMLVPKDDIFQVFYTEDGTGNFSEEMSVRVIVKGNSRIQKLVFELPEDLLITNLRIDVGENIEQGQMLMNNFCVQYFNKKFEAHGKQFFHYFSPTEQIAVDYHNSTITPTKEGELYNPIFYQIDYIITEELRKIQNRELLTK